MSFQPYVPVGGLAGWRFLERTLATQKAAHAQAPDLTRDMAHFRENIAGIDSAEALVADRRLLSVALAAFGLSDDIDSRFLIRKVLEDGTSDPEALANRLTDARYRDLSAAFGFGDATPPNTGAPGFADRIEARFRDRTFEVALGRTSDTMRLALNARREMAALAVDDGTNRTKWFTILGTAPLRKVVEGALGLPSTFAALELDRQVEILESRSAATFGSDRVSDLGTRHLDRLLDRFTATADLSGGGTAVTSPALVLLRGY